MRQNCPHSAISLVVALALALSGCQQVDQDLPFDLDEDEGTTQTIGTSGGLVSVPPSLSMDFPAGAVSGSATVSARKSVSAFPSDAGLAVPGTVFDVSVEPAGTTLLSAVTVQLLVPEALLEAGEALRLAVAVVRSDGSVATFDGSYDAQNGILTAEVDEIGSIAAVISADALAILPGAPDILGGGTFSGTPAPARAPALSSHDAVTFSSACSPEERQCFSSGLIRLWVTDVVRERLGEELAFLESAFDGSLTFSNFVGGIPTTVEGSLSFQGELRARLGDVISSRSVDEEELTGIGTTPLPSALTILGNLMTIAVTTGGDAEDLEFGIAGVGTSELLTVQLEADVEFDNDDGSVDVGQVIAHVRLRK